MHSAYATLKELLSPFSTSDIVNGWVEKDQNWSDHGFEAGHNILLAFKDAD